MDARDDGLQGLPARSQPLIAVAVTCGIAAMAAWYVAAGGRHGGLVQYDAAPTVPDGGFAVNVNTAGVVELAQLPGLGPTTARQIVDHRRARGPFTSVEGLLDVPGVGPATLELIRPHVRPIRPAAPAADQ